MDFKTLCFSCCFLFLFVLHGIAAWDYRNQCSDSMTPSLTKKVADTLDRRRDNPTDHMRSQVSVVMHTIIIILMIYPILFGTGHSSPGGDLSDEELCSGIANLSGGSGMLGGTTTPLGSGYGPNEFEPLAFTTGSAIVDFAQPQQPTAARSRSGSCASRRSQFR